MKAVIALMILILPFPAFAVNEPTRLPECPIPARQADKGADYVPGVDVKGKAVVPADVGSSAASGIPEPLVVPVTIDIAQRVGIPTQGANMDATLGFLEIFADGRVLYNGQDISGKVNAICTGNQPESAPSSDGQAPSDVIEYAPVPAKTTPAPKPERKPAPPVVEKPVGELIEGGEYAD